MKRYGAIIGLKPDNIDQYKRLHAAVWPGVLAQIRRSNIRNYSIFLRKMPDGKYYLTSYFEYVGTDIKADMAKMAADPETQKWWEITNPIQDPLPDRPAGEWWAPLEEVFHTD